ncbi:MAG: SAM-dependent methyltransferase [Acidimicrobiia bacterium]
MARTGYLAAEGFEHELHDELLLAGVRTGRRHGRLVVTDGPAAGSAWAANVWHDVEEIAITSIAHGAKELRDRQRNWAVYAPVHAGRARLIAEKLPYVSAKPIEIGGVAPSAPLGSFTLIEPDRLLAATRCSSPFPNGETRLVEDRVGPPSRAYLKLFETLVRLRRWPVPGESCLDLGASPGGWTWLLAGTGADVVAVDKAPLDPAVAALGNVRWEAGSAFALDPRRCRPVAWLCSDVVCYPQRLLALVRRWVDADAAATMICTIKFQGPTDHGIVREFAAIPGATVLHLSHNKHELTFVRVRP